LGFACKDLALQFGSGGFEMSAKRSRTVLLLFLGAVAAAESYRFDMGGDGTPLAPGYVRVTQRTTLAATPAFGWTREARWVVDRKGPANPWYCDAETSLEFALYSDGVLSMGENTFEFKAAPGRYAVTAVIGDVAIGEPRPGNSIWANGVRVATDVMTNATVKAFRFPVEAGDGKISLRFRADSLQRYATVSAVIAEPLAAGQACEPSVTEHPETQPGPAVYQRNWRRFEDLFAADWGKAKAELAAEGVDVEYWARAVGALRQRPDFREYFGLGLSGWDRIAARADGGVTLKRVGAVFREMGLDGFTVGSPMLTRQLPECGLKHAVSGGAEGFPRHDMTGITLNLMKTAAGAESTHRRVWSNCAPEVIRVFQEGWRRRFADTAKGAAFFMIDEPRGMYYAGGRMGDYSAPAQAAFKRWAAERGWTRLAETGIPARGRTMEFYRFYQFRLESVALFVKAFVADTPVERENVPVMPGNGNIGPGQMNHSCYWPPAMARQGLISASWAYDGPASCKMFAETVRIAEEHGGQHYIVPPLYAEMHSPVQDVAMGTACISALNTRVCAWHVRGVVHGPNRPAWMKAAYYGARLTHATTGLTRLPALYVWCPESLVYNDIVEFNRAEAENWGKVWQALFDANVDYVVTNTLAAPEGAVLLYACVRPVLNREEFGRLNGFVASGGRVLCAFDDPPALPDGTEIAQWRTLPQDRLIRMPLTAASLRGQVDALCEHRNWQTGAAAVRTHLYRRGATRVHLLNNTDTAAAATVTTPGKMKNVFTGKTIAAGATLAIPPGCAALLEALQP